MAWTKVSFLNDTDDPNIGTVSAVYVDENGNEFSYVSRIHVVSGKAGFIAAAKAAMQVWGSDDTDKDFIESDILEDLNA